MSSDAVVCGFVPPDDEVDAVRRLEELGIASLWVGGHLAAPHPSREALVGLARLAVESERATVGTAVLVLPLYPPVVVAKQVAEIDHMAGGRTVLGVGVGGEYRTEFDAVRVPAAERGRRVNEAIPLLRELWRGEPVDHDGPVFPMRAVKVQPPPVQPGGPPIVVAGRQPAAMRRAGALGDGWIPYMYSPKRYRESVAVIREHAAERGRSLDRFGWYLWTTVNVRADGADARRELADFLKESTGQDFEAILDRVAIAGNPDEVTARLAEFVAAGVQHFVFATIPGDRFETIRRLTADIMPAVPASTRSS